MANSQLLGLQKESTSPQPRTYVPIAPPIKAPTIPIMIVTSQPALPCCAQRWPLPRGTLTRHGRCCPLAANATWGMESD